MLENLVPIDLEETIDYIIDGIPDENLQTQARVQQYNSIDAIRKVFSKVTLKVGSDRTAFRRTVNVAYVADESKQTNLRATSSVGSSHSG